MITARFTHLSIREPRAPRRERQRRPWALVVTVVALAGALPLALAATGAAATGAAAAVAPATISIGLQDANGSVGAVVSGADVGLRAQLDLPE